VRFEPALSRGHHTPAENPNDPATAPLVSGLHLLVTVRLSFVTGLCVGALGLSVAACGMKFDVSRIAGLNATFDLARDPEEAIIPECRLVIPPYAPDAVPETVRISRSFSFRGEQRSLAVDVDARLLEASRAIGVERCWMSGFDADEFYENVVFDPAEEPFFEALLVELRRIRGALGLDDSGYAELLAAFVQSLEYKIGDNLPKHPIAAFADGQGDCDEKSALLGGLLAREGYDVCLFLFLEQQHMAVGLHANDIGYLKTGYAFVEATALSYIGHSPFGWHGPEPEVIDLGDGELEYAPAREQVYLELTARRAWEGVDEARDLSMDSFGDGEGRRVLKTAMADVVALSMKGAGAGELSRRIAALSALAPPEFVAVLREVLVYALVARIGDLGEAFAAVSAVSDPTWDAMFRAAAGPEVH